jgi:hypothetical protein
LAKGRERYLSEIQIKIRILAYLYNKGEIGANAYVIQHRANIPLQEYKRFRGFLDELCELSLLDKYEEETRGEKARTIYKITESGRTTVDTCRQPHMKGLLGSIEDLFGAVDKDNDKT